MRHATETETVVSVELQDKALREREQRLRSRDIRAGIHVLREASSFPELSAGAGGENLQVSRDAAIDIIIKFLPWK